MSLLYHCTGSNVMILETSSTVIDDIRFENPVVPLLDLIASPAMWPSAAARLLYTDTLGHRKD